MTDYRPRVYIAGPMRFHPDLNEPEFRRAAAHAASIGWEPVVPKDIPPIDHAGDCPTGYHSGHEGHSGWCYLRADVAVMAACDAVLMLHGWEMSKGATAEYQIAALLRLPIYGEIKPLPVVSE